VGCRMTQFGGSVTLGCRLLGLNLAVLDLMR
jgi:hypothetical protein